MTLASKLFLFARGPFLPFRGRLGKRDYLSPAVFFLSGSTKSWSDAHDGLANEFTIRLSEFFAHQTVIWESDPIYSGNLLIA